MADNREMIARNIADMLSDGDLVNLGVGIPSLVGNYIPEDMTVLLHCENGCVGMEKALDTPWDLSDRDDVAGWMEKMGGENGNWRTGHYDLINASNMPITLIPGACCFDTAMSFSIARGGHLDATVLGGLQVDMDGNLANWSVPGQKVRGMGGAMDLVSGAKSVIVAMEHCSKSGEPKIVKKCSMPLTALNCVDVIVTELCIIHCKDGELTVTAMAPGVTKEELIEKTEATLHFAANIERMKVPD